MGLNKRSRVSAEFSMSSLTDIIFLLLIFFMLTSSLVTPNALNLKLPGTSYPSKITQKPTEIEIRRDGSYVVNGKQVSLASVDRALSKVAKMKQAKNASVMVKPHPKVPHEHVASVMDIALKYGVTAILATDKQ